jgi:predicted negative regulator of RcsB-dependent stress response
VFESRQGHSLHPQGRQTLPTHRIAMAAHTDAAPRPHVLGRPETAADWAQAHGRKVLIVALIIGAAVAGYYLYTATKARKAERAERAYAEAQQALAGGNAPAARTGLQNVATRYGDTPAGVQATIFLAQLLFDEKKYDEGIRRLNDVVGHSAAKAHRSAIHNLIGSAYEEQAKLAEAAAEYRKAADAALVDTDRLTMRANEARILTRANKTDDARRIWKELSDDPTGPMAGEARVRLGELDAKAAGQR